MRKTHRRHQARQVCVYGWVGGREGIEGRQGGVQVAREGCVPPAVSWFLCVLTTAAAVGVPLHREPLTLVVQGCCCDHVCYLLHIDALRRRCCMHHTPLLRCCSAAAWACMTAATQPKGWYNCAACSPGGCGWVCIGTAKLTSCHRCAWAGLVVGLQRVGAV